jgi:pimeloyl-ACP methyl ester carboxylesterase
VVFLHDGLLHRAAWDAQFEALAGEYHLVRYDRRGYGNSAAATKPYSNIADLHGLVMHLGLSPCTLVGSSAGGNLAIQYTLIHPEAVEALVLVGAVVSGFSFSEHFLERSNSITAPLTERNDAKATLENALRDRWLISAANAAAKENVRRIMMENLQNLIRPRDLDPFGEINAFPRLGEIKAPTYILVGEDDIPDAHAHAGAIQAGIRGADRQIIRGAGHLPYIEQPAAFNEALLGILRRPTP